MPERFAPIYSMPPKKKHLTEKKYITASHGYTTVKKLIKLTVGEGEAWSDIIVRDSCMKATNKQNRVGWETEPSHTFCPHASLGLPANLQYLLFRVLVNSWRPSFLTGVYFLFPSVSLFAVPGSLNERPMRCWSQGTPLGRCWFERTTCDLTTRPKASTDQPPCIHDITGLSSDLWRGNKQQLLYKLL